MKPSSQKLKGAKEKFGMDIKIDKRLNAYAKQSLFPDKMKKINKLVGTLEL